MRVAARAAQAPPVLPGRGSRGLPSPPWSSPAVSTGQPRGPVKSPPGVRGGQLRWFQYQRPKSYCPGGSGSVGSADPPLTPPQGYSGTDLVVRLSPMEEQKNKHQVTETRTEK
ncbi:hypothetical protein NDU88_007885 [Pleurodeles waltl]|uniref:Uncharacterized protein n=1 Tax=Pleurodeles waltl TaxID=8319 RepID=A0AAV7STN5_PLEWA|nr:hypothetical protein NDU88_007885 [Pleurodeles waltl]